jgi:NIPSNAP protein
MIYEIRTYQIEPGSLAEVEKRFAEAYEYRKKYSELTGFFHTEIGPLNEIIHIWHYKDLADRARVRADASKDANWPPKIGEFIRTQDAEIVNGFPFIPHPQPGKLGPIYEFRYYELRPGKLPETAKGWESKIGERSKMSPIVFAGGVELGTANGFVHVWAYPSLDARMKIRDEARQKGVWPPPSGGGPRLFTQKNKIMLPSSFSPLQ